MLAGGQRDGLLERATLVIGLDGRDIGLASAVEGGEEGRGQTLDWVAVLNGAGGVEGSLARQVALAALFALGGAVGVKMAGGECLGFLALGEGGALDEWLERCSERDGRGCWPETY